MNELEQLNNTVRELKREIPSGQYRLILLVRVYLANENTRFHSSCPLADLAIK